MSTEAAAPSGALSVDQAVSLITVEPAAPKEPKGPGDAPAATETAVEAEAPSEVEDETQESEVEATTDDAQTEAEEPGGEGDNAETPEPETVVKAPQWWSAEQKVLFAKVPPEVQAVIAETEAAREKIVQQTKAEATARAKDVQSLADQLGGFLPTAVKTFKSRWDGADDAYWLKLSKDDPDKYVEWRAAFDHDRGQLQQLHSATQRAEGEAHKEFIARESAALSEQAPALADPKEGKVRMQKLMGWLREHGATDDQLSGLTAFAAGLAYDGMRMREMEAKGVKGLTKPAPKPAAVARPTATPTGSRSVIAASDRFRKTRSVDDAVAVLLSKQGT